MKSTAVTKGEIKHHLNITLETRDIEKLIRAVHPELNKAQCLSITFRVPSGGDYSGMDLDVDSFQVEAVFEEKFQP